MNQITKHYDRPEFQSEEQAEKDREAHRKLRAYTKKVLKHEYLKSRKEASDTITRLINHWKFDVPGWTPDNTPCPVFHKTKEDLEIEQEIADKREALLGRKKTNKSKLELENDALKAKYDARPPLPEKPKRSPQENIRANAEGIISQFCGTEAAVPMMKAFDKEDYDQVFELALAYDQRFRDDQSAKHKQKREKMGLREATEEECARIQNSLRARPHIDWLDIFDEIIDELKVTPPSPHALGHCIQALKSLNGDLTYDDRAAAKEEILQGVKSLEMYPQSTAPVPKVMKDECTCVTCSNSRALSEVLATIMAEPSQMPEEEKKDIDEMFSFGSESEEEKVKRDEERLSEDRLMEFGKVDTN